MTTANMALLILFAITLQIAAAFAFGIYRRRRELRDSDSGATQKHDHGTPSSILAWEGFREFRVERREIEDANQTICSFYLAPVDNKPLPDFRPGQFLSFGLEIGDPATGDARTVVRCYSLSDACRSDYYRVTIKRVSPPADQPHLPPGVGSSHFHDHAQVGGRLQVGAPSGHFHLQEDSHLPIVLIGGGIGITPMLSILNTVLERGDEREVWLYYGVRNGNEQIMKRQLQALASRHQNFHLHVCYSAPAPGDVEGVDYQHRGRVEMALLKGTLKLGRYQFYVCGPTPLMESLVPGLEDWGVDSADIHYETFGPSTLQRRRKPEMEAPAQPITVTFSETGVSIPWDPAADSLLEFAEANGIEVGSGCRAGSCGCCQTPLNEGEVDYTQQPAAEIAPGHCLLCSSIPKSDLVLSA